MSSIAELFSEWGGELMLKLGGTLDRLEKLLPAEIRRLQASETDIEGLAVVSEMIEAVSKVQGATESERAMLVRWLERLRWGWLASGGRTEEDVRRLARQASELL